MNIAAAVPVPADPSAQHLERRTRERVLAAISEHGPITAAALGALLGLSAAGVRRHLDALADQSVVEEHTPVSGTRGRGRPARAWVLSEAGHLALADDYAELAADAVRVLAEQGGPQAVEAFARARTAGLEKRYAATPSGVGVAERVDALVRVLTRDGYAASARPVGEPGATLQGIQLCQGHCPVGRVAEEFPAFCDAETEAFSRLLGGVPVQRLATLASGAHVCTTFIPTPAASPTTPTATTATTPPGTPTRRPALHPLKPTRAQRTYERSSR